MADETSSRRDFAPSAPSGGGTVGPSDCRAWVPFLALIALVAAAVLVVIPPAPRPADAAPTEVSGSRAHELLERLAVLPRPPGSAEHARVVDFLVAELTAAGYEPERQSGVLGIPLTNLVVAIPGEAPTGTVLCMAHHDSVRRGPGAGDDGAGVVCWLETLRALRARGWRPRNDVLLLLTDGEEQGLLGALMFARTQPRAAAVRTVINLEAIGNGGPACLFELGPRNGRRLALHAEVAPAPRANSLAEPVYHLLPNNTDLSVFLKRGQTGFNLALVAGSPAYHAAHDVPEHVDVRSLQHMADTACALVQRLGDTDLQTIDGEDVSFFDVLGLVVLHWPRAWDRWLAGAALLLALGALARALRTAPQALRAAAGTGLRVVVAAIVPFGVWWLCDAAVAYFRPASWPAGNTTTGALLFVGMVLCSGAVLGARWRADATDLRVQMGLVVTAWAGLGLALSVLLPGAAYVAVLPAWFGLAAEVLRRVAPGQWQTLPTAAALVVSLPTVHMLTQMLQREPVLAAAFAAVAAAAVVALVGPWLVAMRHWRRVLFGLGLAALVVAVVGGRVLVWRSGALWPG